MSRTADQICDAEDMRILKGSVSKIPFICSLSILRPNLLVRLFNGSKAALGGGCNRNIQASETILGQAFLGDWLWAWSTGSISEQMVQEYLEHHRHPSNADNDNFLLE